MNTPCKVWSWERKGRSSDSKTIPKPFLASLARILYTIRLIVASALRYKDSRRYSSFSSHQVNRPLLIDSGTSSHYEKENVIELVHIRLRQTCWNYVQTTIISCSVAYVYIVPPGSALIIRLKNLLVFIIRKVSKELDCVHQHDVREYPLYAYALSKISKKLLCMVTDLMVCAREIVM